LILLGRRFPTHIVVDFWPHLFARKSSFFVCSSPTRNPIAIKNSKLRTGSVTIVSIFAPSRKSSFEYTLTIKNRSERNVVASFAAAAPSNFETSFTEAYGGQELCSIPIDAGQSKDIKLRVRPSSTIDAGHFPVKVTVAAEDATATLDVIGHPQLPVSRRDGLLSARAVAAQQSSVPIMVANTGSAPAGNISLTAANRAGRSRSNR
jgi:uncharacterized membrane protein